MWIAKVLRGDRAPKKHDLKVKKEEIPGKIKEIEAKKEQLLVQYEDAKNIFVDSLDDTTVYIDSNIYMDKRFSNLFDLLLEFTFNILLLEVQYQEIYRCKKSDQPEKAKSARSAFYFIDKLQEQGSLIIEGLDIQGERKAYADPELIERIIQDLKRDKDIVFITEDRDLKIRLRAQLKQESLGAKKIQIYSYDNVPFLKLADEMEILESEYLEKKCEIEKALARLDSQMEDLKEYCRSCGQNVLTYNTEEKDGIFITYRTYCCECGRFISEGHNGV